MHLLSRTLLLALAFSRLPQHALSGALPLAEAGLCDGRDFTGATSFDLSSKAAFDTSVTGDYETADLETWRIARAAIDPVPVVPHVDPEPAPDPPVPEPVDPLDPEIPAVATAATGPNIVLTAFNNPETAGPKVSTAPPDSSATLVASTAPTAAPTATKAPSATEAPSPVTDGTRPTDVPATSVLPDSPDLVCAAAPGSQLARRCPTSDAAKDGDSEGAGDEPLTDIPKRSSYEDVAAGSPNKALAALKAAISNNMPDVDKHALTIGYEQELEAPQTVDAIVSADKTSKVSPALAKNFQDADVNIPLNTHFIRTHIVSRDPKKWSSNPAPRICDAAFSADGKTVISITSHSCNDLTLRDDPKKALTWSEFIFQQLQGFAGSSGALKNLQWIVRNRVSNPGTLQTVQQAYQILGLDTATQKLVLRASDTDQNLATAFDAISRAVNVKGVNWLLADHHNAFGNKQIQTIVMIPSGKEAVGDDGPNLDSVDMFLNLA